MSEYTTWLVCEHDQLPEERKNWLSFDELERDDGARISANHTYRLVLVESEKAVERMRRVAALVRQRGGRVLVASASRLVEEAQRTGRQLAETREHEDFPLPAEGDRQQPTTKWWQQLCTHIFAQKARPERVFVMYGPPGSGKSMALRHIELMVERRTAAGAKPTVARFSAGEFAEDAVHATNLRLLIDSSPVRSDTLVLIDDFDDLAALDARKASELVKELARAVSKYRKHVRCVLATSQWFCSETMPMRRAPLDLHFSPHLVPSVHQESLAAHLVRTVDGLSRRKARAIAQDSRGDARQALLMARLARHDTDAKTLGQSDTKLRDQPSLLVRMARIVKSAAPIERAAAQQDLASEPTDTVFDLTYSNAPTLLASAQHAHTNDLEVLARVAEALSAGQLYRDWTLRTGYAAADGLETDAQIDQSMRALAPLAELKRGIGPHAPLKDIGRFDFSLRKLEKQQRVQMHNADGADRVEQFQALLPRTLAHDRQFFDALSNSKLPVVLQKVFRCAMAELKWTPEQCAATALFYCELNKPPGLPHFLGLPSEPVLAKRIGALRKQEEQTRAGKKRKAGKGDSPASSKTKSAKTPSVFDVLNPMVKASS